MIVKYILTNIHTVVNLVLTPVDLALIPFFLGVGEMILQPETPFDVNCMVLNCTDLK